MFPKFQYFAYYAMTKVTRPDFKYSSETSDPYHLFGLFKFLSQVSVMLQRTLQYFALLRLLRNNQGHTA